LLIIRIDNGKRKIRQGVSPDRGFFKHTYFRKSEEKFMDFNYIQTQFLSGSKFSFRIFNCAKELLTGFRMVV